MEGSITNHPLTETRIPKRPSSDGPKTKKISQERAGTASMVPPLGASKKRKPLLEEKMLAKIDEKARSKRKTPCRSRGGFGIKEKGYRQDRPRKVRKKRTA